MQYRLASSRQARHILRTLPLSGRQLVSVYSRVLVEACPLQGLVRSVTFTSLPHQAFAFAE